jgi:hypothetical protein
MSSVSTSAYTLAGNTIKFPDLASGTAIKNSARRFEAAWDLPPDASFALSAAMVDPAQDRTTINANNPFEHLQAIQTPAGKFLLCHRTELWTSLVSGDGANGRSRYEIQTTNGKGPRLRPWPIGRHHKPAIVDYHPVSLADMSAAVKLSSATIRSPDLITQIARNPRGVWNPPVVVVARAYVRLEDDSVQQRWFLHTIEGSTRVEACHELTATEPAAPFERSDAPLEHLREFHASLVDRFDTTPTSDKSLAAARAATMPALVVVAAVEADMKTPIPGGFPALVNDYVESVHVQPRQFSDVAQSNVIGERFVLTLQEQGRMSHEDSEAVLGRDADVKGKPSVRAAILVHAVCDPANDKILRDFVITVDRAKLTKVKRAKLIGPLVARQFDSTAESADRALMRAFTPDLLLSPWSVTGVDSEELRETCVADVTAGNFDTPALAELMARGGPALCACGVLLSDQGSTVDNHTVLRGSVEKVVEALTWTLGGVNVLADAVAWADGDRAERPRQFDLEGKPKIDTNGDELHYPAVWSRGNMAVRALAFNDDKFPDAATRRRTKAVVPKTPEEAYRANEDTLLELLIQGQTTLGDLYAARDEQNRRLIERIGLRQANIYDKFPSQLSKLYAKYGTDDDPFAEDDLPDETPELEDEES